MNKYREQVADLILKDKEGNDLVVASELHSYPLENTVTFLVSEAELGGAKYKVTIKIEEV